MYENEGLLANRGLKPLVEGSDLPSLPDPLGTGQDVDVADKMVRLATDKMCLLVTFYAHFNTT